MLTVLVLGATAFILCLIFTPICRDLSLRWNLVDLPDQERKFHAKPIPRIGGIPIVLAYACSLGLVFTFAPHGARIYIQHHELLWSLLPAAGVIFLTGLLDDIIGLKPWQKLLGQFAGAGLAVALGTRMAPLDPVHHALLASPWTTIPLSILWLIGCTNAVNLIDGLDGLASGVGLFAAITTLLAGVFSGNVGLMLATMPLVACLLAFLSYNFSPASIFLGDSGSLTIGFMLGCFGLIWSGHTGTMLGMAAPLMALSLPLIDVALAIGRRYLRNVPIFQGDRGHIHHMVLARGFKTRDAALLLYGVCAIFASLALLQAFSQPYLRGIVVIAFLAVVSAGVNYLDYVEIRAARRALSGKRVFQIVRDEIYLRDLERSLVKAETVEECWAIVSKVCQTLHFATVEMYFRETLFQITFEAAAAKHEWKMTVPLGQTGYLKLSRDGEERTLKLMMPTLHRIQDSFAEKEQTLQQREVALSGVA